jgi:protein TonB
MNRLGATHHPRENTHVKPHTLVPLLSPLQWALAASLVLHGGLVTVRFVDAQISKRAFENSALDVVLVNASTDAPDKAAALAQANLAGGGDAAQGRASNPLPSTQDRAGNSALDQALRERSALLRRQTLMVSQVRQQIAALPVLDPLANNATDEELAREEKRRQLIKTLAEIERRINTESSRPKKRYISPATREVVYASYYDQLRRAIEDKGTANFPTLSGQKLYGELTMVITLDHRGRIVTTDIADSSDNPALDRRALAIVHSAAPFGAFSGAMRRQADQLVVVSRFRFTRDDTLQTQP